MGIGKSFVGQNELKLKRPCSGGTKPPPGAAESGDVALREIECDHIVPKHDKPDSGSPPETSDDSGEPERSHCEKETEEGRGVTDENRRHSQVESARRPVSAASYTDCIKGRYNG